MARAGRIHDHADEGRDSTTLVAGAGVGLEHDVWNGLSWWAEAAPALVSIDDGWSNRVRPGLVATLGVGYRLVGSAR